MHLRTLAWLTLVALFAFGGHRMANAQTEFVLIDENEGLLAREEELGEIETDRDSFTPATSVVGRRRLVLESAYTFLDNRRVPETHSLPEFLARYGATEWLELRIGANYEVGGAGNPVSANIPDELEDEPELEEAANVSYGVKLALREQDVWLPRSALVVQAYTPTAGVLTDTHYGLDYVSGWTFANRWSFDAALRFSSGSLEEDRFNIWAPSVVLKAPLGERWKAHVEYFGVFSQGRRRESVQQFFSPGIHYLITENWELGTRVGWGLNDQSPNFFINVGGGVRF
ncbi:MAG: transporter [Pirellulales bacterium]